MQLHKQGLSRRASGAMALIICLAMPEIGWTHGSITSAQEALHGAPNQPSANTWLAARKGRKRRRKAKTPSTKPAPQAPQSSKPVPNDEIAKALPPAPPLPKKFRAVAVLPLVGIDVSDDLLRSIEVALMREIDEARGMRAISPRDVLTDLDKFKINPTCDGDVACLARLGRYARSHASLEVRVASLGGTLSISMRLIDTVKGTVMARVADPISDAASQRANELHRLAIQLLSPKTYVGSLRIVCSEPGADVYLDDKLVGTTPLKKPLARLRAGPHILRISKPGFADLHQFVDVAYKRASTIKVDLNANTISGVIVEEFSATGFGAVFVASKEDDIEIRIDGEPRGRTPLTAPLEKIAAGSRRLSFHREGAPPSIQEVEVREGQRTDVAIHMIDGSLSMRLFGVVNASAPLPDPEQATLQDAFKVTSPPPESQGLTWKFTGGLTLAGLGVVGLMASSYFAYQTDTKNTRAQEIKAMERNGQINADNRDALERELDDLNSEGPLMQNLQWGTLAGGIVFLGVGGALLLLDLKGAFFGDDSGPEVKSDPGGIQVFVDPFGKGGGLMYYQGRF